MLFKMACKNYTVKLAYLQQRTIDYRLSFRKMPVTLTFERMPMMTFKISNVLFRTYLFSS